MLIAYDETSGIVFKVICSRLLNMVRYPWDSTSIRNYSILSAVTTLKVKAIVGVHGRISTMDELVESLRKT